MISNFAVKSNKDFFLEPEDSIMEGIFKQYERVIIESLISSFGLDFLVKDQYGGDVDTINNVRNIGKDKQMNYKNQLNQKTYENREKYSAADYHKGTNYQTIKKEARNNYNQFNKSVEDAYTGTELHFLGRSKGPDSKINAELDHVISSNSIHEDRGRVLSGLNGKDLANSRENLQFTNKSLNASMQDMEIPDYIEKHPELSPEVKANMMKHYNKSKSIYEAKIAKEYYTSSKFAKDITFAAGNIGARMGLREALGFVFAEMWFAVKEEFEKIDKEFDFGKLLIAIGNGIKRGFENAKGKYRDLFERFKEGALAGALSSFTTTLCNIFFTTAKNVAKVIRQSYASVVQAGKVLFINPDNLPFGERMRAIVKILATGASVVAGSLVVEALSKTPIAGIPIIGEIIQSFCGTLVTGILSCTLLYFFDRNDIMYKLVCALNNIHTIDTEVDYFYRQAEYFEKYAAELMNIDIDKFKEETLMYSNIALNITEGKNEEELNTLLKEALNLIGVKIPWEGDFGNFMNDKNLVLIFE